LSDGFAPEQARLFLPAYSLYVRAWWTVSLQGVLHFLSQRLAEDAQKEIREYAQAVAEMVEERFPLVMKVWRETGGKA
jgi:thymidylate synthase (FAD)